MKLRKVLIPILVLISITTSIFSLNLFSKLAPIYSDKTYSDQKVVGLVIQYKDGVVTHDALGNQVALDIPRYKLLPGLDIGNGAWTAKFDKALTEDEALRIAEQLRSDSRVQAVYLDHLVSKAKLGLTAPKFGVLKASTAPTGLSVVDAWNSANPKVAAVSLSWRAPTKLNGGLIWGYRVAQYDTKTKAWVNVISNSYSAITVATIQNNLTAGVRYSFKVAALTKSADGRYFAVSSFTSTASVIPSGLPQVPNLVTSDTISSATPVIRWSRQTIIERGGLPVTYSVLASASDGTSASCNSGGITCSLSGLQAGKVYSVVLTATNARGSSSTVVLQAASDPDISKQWYLDSKYGINVSKAWKITKGSPDIVVAVVDTGITSHPDLNENVVTGYDFISDPTNSGDGNGRDADPADPGDWTAKEDSSWHGTHVAGIIAAETNDIGISGIAPKVKISPVRVLGKRGGSESDIAAGINWSIGLRISGAITNPNPAKVINLSIGSSSVAYCYGGGYKGPTQLAIENAKAADVTILTAAGNDDTYATDSYPGNCYGNITIGATDYNGFKTAYSNYSIYSSQQKIYIGVDISAPGGDFESGMGEAGGIYSTLNDGLTEPGNPIYAYEQGTSMASPVAAGVVALMYSVKPDISDDQVWEILSTTAKPFATTSNCAKQIISTTIDSTQIKSGLCGIGIIDAGAAVAAVLKLNN